MSKYKKLCEWFKVSSFLVGGPVMLILIVAGSELFVFTLTCKAAGYKCEHSLSANEGLTDYMGDLLTANPNMDIVAKKR